MLLFVAPPTGLEPVTSWLTVMRSTDWAMEEYTIFFDFTQRFLFRLHKEQSFLLLKSPVADLNNIFSCSSGWVIVSGTFLYTRTTDWAMEEYIAKHPIGCIALSWHLPIFPGRRQPSIFGTTELNFCVRYGNRWTLSVINTNYFTVLIYAKAFRFIHSFWWLVRESNPRCRRERPES